MFCVKRSIASFFLNELWSTDGILVEPLGDYWEAWLMLRGMDPDTISTLFWLEGNQYGVRWYDENLQKYR